MTNCPVDKCASGTIWSNHRHRSERTAELPIVKDPEGTLTVFGVVGVVQGHEAFVGVRLVRMEQNLQFVGFAGECQHRPLPTVPVRELERRMKSEAVCKQKGFYLWEVGVELDSAGGFRGSVKQQ